MGSKNIVFHVTAKYMKLNKRRTAVTFIGIVFMVILMTCVFAGKRTVMEYLDKVASLDKGSWQVIAYDLTSEEASKVMAMEEVEGFGESSPMGVIDFPQTGDPQNKPFLEVKAYSPESFGIMNIHLTEGRLPENENEMIISASAAEEGSSIKCGDRISGDFFDRTITGIKEGVTSMFPFDGIELHYGETVTVPAGFMARSDDASYREDKAPNGKKGDFTVVGIMASPSFEKTAGASYSALCGMNADTVHTAADINLFLRLNKEKANDVYDFRESLRDLLGKEVRTDENTMLLIFSASSGDSTMNSIVLFIEIFFTVFIMAASIILIYNVFNMSFAERARYLGMLSSVGATRKQKRQSIFFECFSLLLPALPVGMILGCTTVKGAMQLLKPHLDLFISTVKTGLGTDVPVDLTMRFADVCIITALCILTVLLSALIPAIKISRIGPFESVRGGAENTKPKKGFKTRKSLLEKGKPEMLLAVNCTTRSKHLTKGIMRSICVFAVLTIVTLYGARSVVKVAESISDESGWSPEYDGYDYITAVRQGTENQSALKDLFAGEDSVTDTKEIVALPHELYVDGRVMSDEYFDSYKQIFFQFSDNTEQEWEDHAPYIKDISFDIIAVEDEEYRTIASKCGADMSIADDTSIPSALIYDKMFFSTDRYVLGDQSKGYKYIEIDNVTKLGSGDSFALRGYSQEKKNTVDIPLTFAGTVDESALKGRLKVNSDCPFMIINQSALDKVTEETDPFCLTYTLLACDKEKSSRFISELGDISEKSLTSGEGEIALMDYDNRNAAANMRQVITQIVKILAYCFTALISVVCLLNLYNSIRGRAAERTKETAVLRSVGMTDKQLAKMHDLENLMIFGKGIGIAAVICAVLSAVIRYFIVGFFGNVELPVPVLLSVGIAVCIFAASSIMTRICSRSAKKCDIIEKIRRETV